MIDTILDELFGKFLVYFEREAVRSQFEAILLAVIIAIVVARVVIFVSNRWLLGYGVDSPGRGKIARYLHNPILPILQQVTLPIAGLIALEITLTNFTARHALVGIISKAINLFLIFLIYRIALALLYALFSHTTMRRFHYRLIGPLFTLFILYQLTNDFVRYPTLAEITLLNRPENPLTLGSLFIVLVGLYFWIDSVLGIGDILNNLIVRYTNLSPGKVEGFLTLIGYILIGFGLYFGLTNLGLDPTVIAAVTGGLSIGIGFGMQETLTSFIGGLILLFEGTIEPGDILTLDNDRADVKKLGIRSTLVRRLDGTELLIPNAKLFTSEVTKRTGSDSLIRTFIHARASYKDDPDTVRRILVEAGESFPKLLLSPKPPVAYIEEFGEYAIKYRLEVWSDHRVIGPDGVRMNLNPIIYELFRQNNIEMPYPQTGVHLHTPATSI